MHPVSHFMEIEKPKEKVESRIIAVSHFRQSILDIQQIKHEKRVKRIDALLLEEMTAISIFRHIVHPSCKDTRILQGQPEPVSTALALYPKRPDDIW